MYPFKIRNRLILRRVAFHRKPWTQQRFCFSHKILLLLISSIFNFLNLNNFYKLFLLLIKTFCYNKCLFISVLYLVPINLGYKETKFSSTATLIKGWRLQGVPINYDRQIFTVLSHLTQLKDFTKKSGLFPFRL